MWEKMKEIKMKAVLIGAAALLAFAVTTAAVSQSVKYPVPQAAICNGQVAGQDTDPNVVQKIERDCGTIDR
jgi:hypothetical protein